VCGLCHTQIDRTRIYNVDAAFLAGGMRVGYYPPRLLVSRNLLRILRRPGSLDWCRQIIRALRDGQADRALIRSRCSGRSSTAFTDEDATAIATFLKTVSRPVA